MWDLKNNMEGGSRVIWAGTAATVGAGVIFAGLLLAMVQKPYMEQRLLSIYKNYLFVIKACIFGRRFDFLAFYLSHVIYG